MILSESLAEEKKVCLFVCVCVCVYTHVSSPESQRSISDVFFYYSLFLEIDSLPEFGDH